MTTNQHIIDAAKSLLDTVEPDGFIDSAGDLYPTNWLTKDEEASLSEVYSKRKIEYLLAECRKQTRKEVFNELSAHYLEQIDYSDANNECEISVNDTLTKVSVELRRMAEGEE